MEADPKKIFIKKINTSSIHAKNIQLKKIYQFIRDTKIPHVNYLFADELAN